MSNASCCLLSVKHLRNSTLGPAKLGRYFSFTYLTLSFQEKFTTRIQNITLNTFVLKANIETLFETIFYSGDECAPSNSLLLPTPQKIPCIGGEGKRGAVTRE